MAYAQAPHDVPARGLRRVGSRGSRQAGDRERDVKQAPSASGGVAGRYTARRREDEAFGGNGDRGSWRKPQKGTYAISTHVTEDDVKNMSFRPKINKVRTVCGCFVVCVCVCARARVWRHFELTRHTCVPQNYHFEGEELDFKTRQEIAEQRRKLRLMHLRQVAWEAEEAAYATAVAATTPLRMSHSSVVCASL